jgi:DnaK suppressor protein
MSGTQPGKERGDSNMTLDLQQIKQRLQEKEAELREQLREQTEARPTPVDPIEASEGPQDFEETAVDFLEMQQEQSVSVNEQALLTEVRDALKRIDEGTYGRCVVCGQPIPEKRLEAIPWASRCLKDEAQLEQRNLSEEQTYNTDTY